MNVWSCNSGRFDLIYPNFTIRNAEDQVVLKIKGPFFTCSCGQNVEFQVFAPDGTTEVGKISKQWSGLFKEYFTDADNFGIQCELVAQAIHATVCSDVLCAQLEGIEIQALFCLDSASLLPLSLSAHLSPSSSLSSPHSPPLTLLPSLSSPHSPPLTLLPSSPPLLLLSLPCQSQWTWMLR